LTARLVLPGGMDSLMQGSKVGGFPFAGAAARGERVVIVGAGEQAALAFEYFTYDSPHEVIAFSAEPEFITTDVFCGLPVVPFDKLAVECPPTGHQAFVAVSSTQLNRVRRRLYGAVKAVGYRCVSYVSSRAFVSPSVQIGENTFVLEGNSLHHLARIGNDVILMSGVHVGHQSVIEDDCFLASRVVIAGSCRVGRGSFLGIASCVANNLSVAEDCLIGAGAVVIKDTITRQVYAGNPARPTGRDSLAGSGPATSGLAGSAQHAAASGHSLRLRDSVRDPSGPLASDVLRIFREICFLPPHAPVDMTQALAEHPGWDSLRNIEFIVQLEQCLDVRLTEADLLDATTVGAVISVLEAKHGRS
jgi:sugar O-acyltransferase (sialic acid O-acetyltransferase NeuD family)